MKKSAIGIGLLILIALFIFLSREKSKPSASQQASNLKTFRSDYISLSLPESSWACLRAQDQNSCYFWECHDMNGQRADRAFVRQNHGELPPKAEGFADRWRAEFDKHGLDRVVIDSAAPPVPPLDEEMADRIKKLLPPQLQDDATDKDTQLQQAQAAERAAENDARFQGGAIQEWQRLHGNEPIPEEQWKIWYRMAQSNNGQPAYGQGAGVNAYGVY